MSKSRKELKENELAGAITDQFDQIKPHLPKILIGVIAIVAIVFGINAVISSRSSAKEAKSINLVLFSVENSAAGSLATLDQQIDDFPDEEATAWAHLLKADRELTSGLEKIFVDKLAGRDFIQRSLKSFEKADKVAGGNQLVKLRALFGWARALESLGQFDDAAAKYAEVAKAGEDTPFKNLAEKGIVRVNNPHNQEFYILFNERENNTIVQGGAGATSTDSAPSTNSGLPSRPDFTYPGEEIVPGSTGDNNEAPKSDPGSEKGKVKKDDAPPMPSEDILGKKPQDEKEKTEKKDESSEPKAKSGTEENKKQDTPKTDSAENKSNK